MALSLERGDLLPRMSTDVPGPASLRLSEEIGRLEAPGINTLYGGKPNLFWHQALGSNVLDVDGNIFIDLTAGFGVAGVGHRHPKVVAAVEQQTKSLIHGLGDAIGHPYRVELARRLQRISPIPDTRVYFAVSGADAVEIAVKTALLVHRGRRSKILAFRPSYHGLTLGALGLSSREAFRNPFSAHLHPEVDHLPYACDPGQVEEALDRRGDVAAVVMEPIVGREGVLVPPEGWSTALARLCRDKGALLIADEIFTGFGRAGSWFAVDREKVVPDLICCGKSMTGGMPMAAVLGPSKLMEAWASPGEALHTGTFVAHPVACAAASANLDVLEAENLCAKAVDIGRRIGARTADWTRRFPAVVDVRGVGALWGFELADADLGAVVVREAWRRGILVLVGGPEGRVGQIVPPLVVTRQQLDHALGALEEILGSLEGR